MGMNCKPQTKIYKRKQINKMMTLNHYNMRQMKITNKDYAVAKTKPT